MQSFKNTLNSEDFKAQLKSAFIFLAPTIVSLLVTLSPLVDVYFKGAPEKVAFGVILKWVLDQLTGLCRKYIAGPVKVTKKKK